MEFHPIAEDYPLMSEAELAELAADLEARGQIELVWTYEGKILDGRNRWLACERAGIPCETAAYMGDDPEGFAASLNLYRKHYQAKMRQRLVKKYRAKGMNTRQIGAKLGVDQKTVVNDLALSVEENSSTDNPAPATERVTGKDDKSYPASRPPPEVVQERIERARELHGQGMTQRQIAESLGVAQSAVSGYLKKGGQENGETNGTKETKAQPARTEKEEKALTKALDCGNKAIDCLKQIPKNNAFWERGFQLVTDWIRQERKVKRG